MAPDNVHRTVEARWCRYQFGSGDMAPSKVATNRRGTGLPDAGGLFVPIDVSPILTSPYRRQYAPSNGRADVPSIWAGTEWLGVIVICAEL